ncbi:MAG: hypothetical protein KF878_06300 [Planctomycetes bacterium]|nr:hypothetical protein [Planctomycetota bacterium]
MTRPRRYVPFFPMLGVVLAMLLYGQVHDGRLRLADLRAPVGLVVGAWLGWRALASLPDGLRVARHRARVDGLTAFARGLHDGRIEGAGFYEAGAAVVSGARRGRRVRLVVQRERVTLEVRVEHPVAAFDLTRPALPARLGRAVRGASRPWALGRHEGLAPGALERVEVERALERLFRDHRVTRLTLGPTLRAERPLGDLDPDALEAAFDLLAEVAAPFERRAVAVRAVPGDHFACSGGGRLRCPYCRDDLSLDDERLAPCGACRTLHHVDCLDEAGGCTVMGCEGGPARSERRRRVGA